MPHYFVGGVGVGVSLLVVRIITIRSTWQRRRGRAADEAFHPLELENVPTSARKRGRGMKGSDH
jgi:hypothetical protein